MVTKESKKEKKSLVVGSVFIYLTLRELERVGVSYYGAVCTVSGFGLQFQKEDNRQDRQRQTNEGRARVR